jgi:ATP-dependent DNA helicase RecQ
LSAVFVGYAAVSMRLPWKRTLFPTFTLRRTARRQFGWERLRPGQLDPMRALLSGRDAVVVMPTGAGKSAIYQVPAAVLSGPTLVVSPLLALQQDQLTGLNGRTGDTLGAVRLSSAQTPKAQAEALQAVRDGRARFLFVTPEQLAKPDRLAEIAAMRPALVAIDEAHCISAWGHDFRPDYLALGSTLAALTRGRSGRPPIVALTATASPPVREDIIARLRLRNPYQLVSGLDRPNLFLAASHCASEEHRWRRLLAALRADSSTGDRSSLGGAAIVYLPTRRAAEEVAQRLVREGFDAQAYHGGMATRQREQRHEDFLADRIRIMVATSAFGMGIDKPDIRTVVHLALPDSPDSYLQEIGRAGRDGRPARTTLLYRREDVALQRYFTGGAPDAGQIRDLVALVRAQSPTRAALREHSGLSQRKLTQLLSLLEHLGVVVTGDQGRLVSPPDAPVPTEAARLALAEVARFQTVQRSRIDMMLSLAEGRRCRTQTLLAYFGDPSSTLPCGHCDTCAGGTAEAAPAGYPFPVHTGVHHAEWGIGTVLGYAGDRMTVLFDKVGYKTLSTRVVRDRGLLVPRTGDEPAQV